MATSRNPIRMATKLVTRGVLAVGAGAVGAAHAATQGVRDLYQEARQEYEAEKHLSTGGQWAAAAPAASPGSSAASGVLNETPVTLIDTPTGAAPRSTSRAKAGGAGGRGRKKNIADGESELVLPPDIASKKPRRKKATGLGDEPVVTKAGKPRKPRAAGEGATLKGPRKGGRKPKGAEVDSPIASSVTEAGGVEGGSSILLPGDPGFTGQA